MTDIEIVNGCKLNNAKYQRMLLDKYSPVLMSVAMRYVNDQSQAQDALQEMWIKVFNHIHNYTEEGKLMGWLKRILVNVILQGKRKKDRLQFNAEITENSISTLPEAEINLNINDLMNIVHQVPSPAKEVFLMYAVDGMSHKEIAKSMQIAESTSRVHLLNARKRLRKLFINMKEITL